MIKRAALDTRLQHGLLLDPKLQRRLSGDEFRSFISLLVWVVSLVSDGSFDPDESEMIIGDRQHIDTLEKVGLVERDDSGLCRIHPDYWAWQTSKAQLEALDAKRESERLRKQKQRKAAAEMQPEEPF